MDWDLKMPAAGAAWDLAELEQGGGGGPAADGIAAAAAAGGGGGDGRAECSVDLKLGGLGESGGGQAQAQAQDSSVRGGKAPVAASASASASGKRPRAAAAASSSSGGGGGQGQQCPSCAVDGCRADLSRCRDYHRRHKVCEAHSKTPVVAVAGRDMRFCQQCSRFHLLTEFDETKRSCRKRLDGHNRRRRKPQPDTMNSASFMTSQQGTRFSPFPNPRPEQNWAGIIKTEESPYYTHQIPTIGISNRQHFGGSTSTYAKEGRRFPFLQEGEINFATGVALEPSACQPHLKTAAPTDNSGSSKMFSDGLTPVLDSDCALSLLSAPANSSGIDVGRMVQVQQSEHIPIAQPLVSSLQFSSSSWFARSQAATGAVPPTGFSCPGVENEQLNTFLRSDNNDMNYSGIFHVGGEGSSDGAPPSLPFSWQ